MTESTIERLFKNAQEALDSAWSELRLQWDSEDPDPSAIPIQQAQESIGALRAVVDQVLIGENPSEGVRALRTQLASWEELLAQARKLGEETLADEVDRFTRILRETKSYEERVQLAETLSEQAKRAGQLASEIAGKKKRLGEIDQEKEDLDARDHLARQEISRLQKELEHLPDAERIQRDREKCVETARQIQALQTHLEARLLRKK